MPVNRKKRSSKCGTHFSIKTSYRQSKPSPLQHHKHDRQFIDLDKELLQLLFDLPKTSASRPVHNRPSYFQHYPSFLLFTLRPSHPLTHLPRSLRSVEPVSSLRDRSWDQRLPLNTNFPESSIFRTSSSHTPRLSTSHPQLRQATCKQHPAFSIPRNIPPITSLIAITGNRRHVRSHHFRYLRGSGHRGI